jgi:hypothetical protein
VGGDPDVRRALWEQGWVRDWIARTWGTHVMLALMCLLFGLTVSTVLATLAVAVLSLLMLFRRLRVSRTLPDVARLIDTEPARLVEVESLGRRVFRVDQTLLHGSGSVRGERAWLLGPDDNGIAVFFDEASPTPHAARVVDQPPRPGGRSVGRPRDPRSAAKLAAIVGLVVYVIRWAFGVAITVCIGLELAPQPQVLAVLYVIAGVVIAVFMTRNWLRRMRWRLGSGRLFEPPLVEYQARLHADRSFAVTTEDGAEFVAKVFWEKDVAANVRASGRLWIAGTPAAGVTLGVGVPDFPVAGVVRFNK